VRINLDNAIKKDFYICLFFLAIFILLWSFLFFQSFIGQGFVWDDLHLIKKYDNSFLIKVWLSNWDMDNIETPSYRPLGIFFYHLVANIFEENIYQLRIFIIVLMFILMGLVNYFFFLLGAEKNTLILFNFLLVCSKIFATLISWYTLVVPIFAYIFFFLALINFLLFKIKNKDINLIFSIFFCFVSVFTREELYSIMLIIPILSYFIDKKILRSLLISIPFFLIVISHYYLRDIFVPEATKISFIDSINNIPYYLRSVIASALPMSYLKPHVNDLINDITFIIWSLFLLFILKKIKNDFQIIISKNKIYFLFFFFGLITCLPNLIQARPFGVFIPTSFFFVIICSLIIKILDENIDKTKKGLIFLVIFASSIGGLLRSNNQIISMNKFSADIISYDSHFVFGYSKKGKVTIPEDKLIKKVEFLNSLGIYNEVSRNDLIELENPKIIFLKNYNPLSF
jgi:hypothetical protein